MRKPQPTDSLVAIADRLKMRPAERTHRAFLAVMALVYACDVELRLCATAPEGAEPSPIKTSFSALVRGQELAHPSPVPMVWAKRDAIFWNEAVTFDTYIRWDRAPEMFVVLLHDLGHVAAKGTYRQLKGAVRHTRWLDASHLGLANEDVAARWSRYAARGLWGQGTYEERHMQRFDLQTGYKMPPRGPRIDPEPMPAEAQLAEARETYGILLAKTRRLPLPSLAGSLGGAS